MKTKLFFLTAITLVALCSCVYLPAQTDRITNTIGDIKEMVTPPTPIETYQISQGGVQVMYPRQGQDPAPALKSLYDMSTDSLDIAVYSLTHPTVVKAIGDAHKRGVKVRLITDRIQSQGNTQKHAMNDLITIGIPIKTETHTGLMHIKCSIVDKKIATTGSYNYSTGASKENDEMFVVIYEPWFASICQLEFDRMWNSPQFVDLGMSY